MNRAKPIEAGCMAMIVNAPREQARWSGVIVTVIRYCEKIGRGENPGWVIDIPDPSSESGFAALQPQYLLRIDDPDNQKQIETEREKVYVLSGD